MKSYLSRGARSDKPFDPFGKLRASYFDFTQYKFAQDKRGDGFTLVELLVVIAVIALLMAILVPALSKARQIAQRVVCQSNLKQLAVAWMMYLDDNDGYFYQGVNVNLYYGGWRGEKFETALQEDVPLRPLNYYVGLPTFLTVENDAKRGAKVFSCPADKGGVPGYALRQKVFLYLGTSYNTNIFLIGQDECPVYSTKTKPLDEEISKRLGNLNRDRVDNPSLLLLIGDNGWNRQWQPKPHPRPEYKELAEWHGRPDYYNMAFLDGHTAFMEIRKGYYVVTGEYSVLPFEELYPLAHQIQGD